jgi:hypothetical protein
MEAAPNINIHLKRNQRAIVSLVCLDLTEVDEDISSIYIHDMTWHPWDLKNVMRCPIVSIVLMNFKHAVWTWMQLCLSAKHNKGNHIALVNTIPSGPSHMIINLCRLHLSAATNSNSTCYCMTMNNYLVVNFKT